MSIEPALEVLRSSPPAGPSGRAGSEPPPEVPTSEVGPPLTEGGVRGTKCKLSREDFDTLCDLAGVRPPYQARFPDPTETALGAKEGEIVVYSRAVEAGLRLPIHPLIASALRLHNLCPTQLAPNSWRTICSYIVLLHELGRTPELRFFRVLFSLKRSPGHPDWLYFTARAGRSFLGDRPTSLKGWRSRFFFVSSEKGWDFPTRWGEPRFDLEANRLHLTDEGEELLKKLTDFGRPSMDSILTPERMKAAGLGMSLFARACKSAEKKKEAPPKVGEPSGSSSRKRASAEPEDGEILPGKRSKRVAQKPPRSAPIDVEDVSPINSAPPAPEFAEAGPAFQRGSSPSCPPDEAGGPAASLLRNSRALLKRMEPLLPEGAAARISARDHRAAIASAQSSMCFALYQQAELSSRLEDMMEALESCMAGRSELASRLAEKEAAYSNCLQSAEKIKAMAEDARVKQTSAEVRAKEAEEALKRTQDELLQARAEARTERERCLGLGQRCASLEEEVKGAKAAGVAELRASEEFKDEMSEMAAAGGREAFQMVKNFIRYFPNEDVLEVEFFDCYKRVEAASAPPLTPGADIELSDLSGGEN